MGLVGEEPVATISVVKYGRSFGFLGFYIVKAAYRGQGHGLRLWNAGMAYLSGRTVGLDGVVAQQHNYRKSGFVLAWRNIRFQGVAGKGGNADPQTVPLATLPFADVLAYDRPFFPEDRAQFLQCWIAQPQSTALGLVHGGRLSGYGVLRACREGCKIGPLFADSAEFAERLFVSLQAAAPQGTPIYLDAPETNPAALDLAKRHSMSLVFETARMYAGAAPTLPINRLYGVTSFELG